MWLYTLLRANHNKARSLEAAMDQIEDNLFMAIFALQIGLTPVSLLLSALLGFLLLKRYLLLSSCLVFDCFPPRSCSWLVDSS